MFFEREICNADAPTDITPPIADITVAQDQTIQLFDADVEASDEYDAYTQDRYELYILVDNQGAWIRVDDGTYNTANDGWEGEDITFDPETGAFEWTPGNADVPNDPTDGLYHTLRVVHYDHYGEAFTTFDDEFFRVYVNNLPPLLPQSPPSDLPNGMLTEDDTAPAAYTYSGDLVNSDEEHFGATYSLWIDGVLWMAGHRPNGPEGGVVFFDNQTGEIIWQATNADVTTEIDGDPVHPLYIFEIQADDGNAQANPANQNLSPRRAFTVEVWNNPTAMTAVPAGGNITEDSTFTFDIQASDEELERPLADPAWRDATFTLTIDDGSGFVYFSIYNAGNGVRADVSFVGADLIGLTDGNVIVYTTGSVVVDTIEVSNGNTTQPTITLAGISGNGTLSISIWGDDVIDQAGNTPAATGPSTAVLVHRDVLINEMDALSGDPDETEFIELFDGGRGETDLTGLVLVFYDGETDSVYYAHDLDTFNTNDDGYFVLGNPLVAVADDTFPAGSLDDGSDAVALYVGEPADFAFGTPLTATHLVDALVYDSGQADDVELLVLLNDGQTQVSETDGDSTDSIQRCPDGSGGAGNTDTYIQSIPTPGEANACVIAPIVTTQTATAVTATTAMGNGSIIDAGVPGPTQHGVCWSTVSNPTIADNRTEEGAAGSIGTFSSLMTGLLSDTLYYYRAYATHAQGHAYGLVQTFTTSVDISPPAFYTITFRTDGDGSLSGMSSQTVEALADCTSVTAVPDEDCYFRGWTGDYTGNENPLTLTQISSDMSVTAIFAADVDSDNDGINDTFEQGPDGNDPEFDGNNDGFIDYQQDNVASLFTYDHRYYITVSVSDANSIAFIRSVEEPSSGSPPPDVYFPVGFVDMQITNMVAGDAVSVEITIHYGPVADTFSFYIIKNISGVADPWINFIYDTDTETGVTFPADQTIRIHLKDGQAGDTDISINGIVDFFGGPGVPMESSSSGGSCFVNTGIAAVMDFFSKRSDAD